MKLSRLVVETACLLFVGVAVCMMRCKMQHWLLSDDATSYTVYSDGGGFPSPSPRAR